MTALATVAARVVPAAAVFPDFGGVAASGQLKAVIGTLLTFVLIIAVLMLIVCAVIWAVSSSHGNYSAATKARTDLFVALGGAALAGGGVAWMNFLLGVGSTL
ncbi:Putative uncharacterized protein [Propionibacterium freudenreichii subsp. freudenreichii]|uniref:Integral membrane protein n=1 Tax=Propionibacterium freudenreichii subsp. freudenreichii TaxID=66712 RepID=A0A0B7NZU2_PROFF|nr:DUF6112 family protein [Propionibacterium freudenreichii]CEP26438.1 Putative uncharacterized protein [Propionibacterium freudenreichii subsp. freudenreichii]MDK9646450.1 hypothetical protein [Propionibacterium freudenreichii]MDK9656077.1 hypothetical protein [Propionibacterium freudenreichii]MDK9666960.1 hypothetical protein [Propionibacterium freudenreichii]SBN42969.1 Hypothetical protein PFR_J18_631 [Propionibacterium freudenreichii]